MAKYGELLPRKQFVIPGEITVPGSKRGFGGAGNEGDEGGGGGFSLGHALNLALTGPLKAVQRVVLPPVLELAQGADQLYAKTHLLGSGNARKNVAARKAAGITGFSLKEAIMPGKDSSGKTVKLMDDPSITDDPWYVRLPLQLGLDFATDPTLRLGKVVKIFEAAEAAKAAEGVAEVAAAVEKGASVGDVAAAAAKTAAKPGRFTKIIAGDRKSVV